MPSCGRVRRCESRTRVPHSMPVLALGLGYGADGEVHVQHKRKNSVQYCILELVHVHDLGLYKMYMYVDH